MPGMLFGCTEAVFALGRTSAKLPLGDELAFQLWNIAEFVENDLCMEIGRLGGIE